jgi:hypothetical protein
MACHPSNNDALLPNAQYDLGCFRHTLAMEQISKNCGARRMNRRGTADKHPEWDDALLFKSTSDRGDLVGRFNPKP